MSARKTPIKPCPVCKVNFIYRLNVKTCSHKCAAALVRKPGPPRYVGTSWGGKVLREHVVIASKSLGREVPKGWEVHHINEIKNDNRPENLVVCESTRLHRLLHARPNLLEWCKWLGAEEKSVRIFHEFEGSYCLGCETVLPVDSFYVRGGGTRGECKECQSKTQKDKLREFRKKNPAQNPKGYSSPGENNAAAKLTEGSVLQIRERLTQGVARASLARSFGVSVDAIGLIARRKTWSHI